MQHWLRRVVLPALCLLASIQLAPQLQAQPTKSALLIGIWTYKHPKADYRPPAGVPHTGRYEPDVEYNDLKGPPVDIENMRKLLTSEKFAFPSDHIHTLLDKDATRTAILAAMQQYVVTDPKPGDTVVLYISSHGSMRADPDPKAKGQTYDLDGTGQNPMHVQNTIVPYDWYIGQDDVFSRDLRHIFNLAANKGVHVTALFDSCHSGSIARGAKLGDRGGVRSFDFDPRPMTPDPYPAEASGTPPEERKDNPVLVLSAAQKDQSAIDAPPDPDHGNQPHGLFTSALIDTLETLPANRPVDDVFKRLQIAIELAPNTASQQPELDATPTRRQQPLFGGAAGTGPATAAVVSVDASGILLDIGSVANIGPGSEFTAINGSPTVLKVEESIGLTRSRAKVLSPPGATVRPLDIVQLSRAVPAQQPVLSFYAGSANPPLAEIQSAINTLRTAGVHLAADPSFDPWTHRIAWEQGHWNLYPHSQKLNGIKPKVFPPTPLAAKLSPADLKSLPPNSLVWFDAPLPKESVSSLLASAEQAAAQLTTDRAKATYVLAGTPTPHAIQYAWFNRGDFDTEAKTTKESPGCSPASPYPLRTNWAEADPSGSHIAALNDSAMQLARLNGWLSLESSPLSNRSDYPYKLVLHANAANRDIADGEPTFPDLYDLVLTGSPDADANPRWIYVLGINCQGEGTLVWPYDAVRPTSIPSDKGKLERIKLDGTPFPVCPPFGTDTYLLLTTSTRLQNPSALEFKGVVSRGVEQQSVKPSDPLENLLDATSAGTRGDPGPTPTLWSVQTLRTQSSRNGMKLPEGCSQ